MCDDADEIKQNRIKQTKTTGDGHRRLRLLFSTERQVHGATNVREVSLFLQEYRQYSVAVVQ